VVSLVRGAYRFRVSDARAFAIESVAAGPYVTVMTVSGPVEDGAQEMLRTELAAPGLASQRIVVDLTEATLYDSWPFALLADETRRFERAGGQLVVVSGDNSTVDPFVGDVSLPGVRWFASLNDALTEMLGEVVAQTSWSTELPESV
jgi:anti-anti-sigma regulatory factor